MTERTLYQILGVKKTATRDEIRAAYRLKSKAAHPDVGGSEDVFQELFNAAAILSDDTQRQIYDETGVTTRKGPDNSEAVLAGIIIAALDEAIAAADKQNFDPMQCDLMAAILQSFDIRQGKLAKTRSSAEKQLRLTRRLVKAWSRRGDGKNLMALMLANRIVILEAAITRMDGENKGIAAAREAMKDYSFRPEIQVFV